LARGAFVPRDTAAVSERGVMIADFTARFFAAKNVAAGKAANGGSTAGTRIFRALGTARHAVPATHG
jgi:uncharacterized protein YqgC (DUF456 family)